MESDQDFADFHVDSGSEWVALTFLDESEGLVFLPLSGDVLLSSSDAIRGLTSPSQNDDESDKLREAVERLGARLD